MNLIVGSGPAGIAAARALLDLNEPVTLLDGGLELEAERRQAAEVLARTPPERWPSDAAQELSLVRSNMRSGPSGVPLKVAFGSDFPYRATDRYVPVRLVGADTSPSLARGGLSNVWGAAMLPYLDRDLESWPIRVEDLAPHYRAVAGFVASSGRRDQLERYFPLYGTGSAPLPMSAQAAWILDQIAESADRLADSHICAGASRLAVKGGPDGCVACRLCMYGCPFGFIYNSAATLKDLARHPRFHYRSGIVVEAVGETSSSVEVQAREMGRDGVLHIRGSRAYLAAGVLSTTGILARSMGLVDVPLVMRDSQYFLIPALLRQRVRGASQERLHTLSQVFLEILKPGEHTVHLQLYTYSDLYEAALGAVFGQFVGPIRRVIRPLLERLVVLQGYLHSDHSRPVEVTLRPDGVLEVSVAHNPETSRRVKEAVARVLRHKEALGLRPLATLLRIARPGRGFHSGGTFPMRTHPGPLDTDVLGRPRGFQRVHAVDSTVFPDIPATTITFTAMANAHRIATGTAGTAGKAAMPGRVLCVGVTGASGYGGGAIARHLRRNGCTVVALQRRPPLRSQSYLRFALEEPPPEGALRGLDALIHCAYDFRAYGWKDIEERNVHGTLELFARARRAGIPALVFLSTMSAYEGCQSLYGRAKLSVERQAEAIGFFVVRSGLLYGDQPGGMVGALRKLLSFTPIVPVVGGGGQRLHATHEDDLGNLILRLARTVPHRLMGKPIVAASRHGITFRALLEALSRSAGRRNLVVRVPYLMPWLGLRLLELGGVRMRLRSDSLKSLMHQDPHPDFTWTDQVGCAFRDFVPIAQGSSRAAGDPAAWRSRSETAAELEMNRERWV